MKPAIGSFILVTLLGLTCAVANAVDIRDLSMTPSHACKKPPKAPPYALLHKEYNAYGTATNYPFNDTVDINGDGWCDWVSIAARAPHRGDTEEPQIADFILLGTKSGWRNFGNTKKFLLDRSSFTAPGSGWVPPFSGVSGFIFPTFVYSRKESAPYFAALSSFEDIAPPSVQNINVFQWSDAFDMPRTVSADDRKTILLFLSDALCKTSKAEDSLASVICEADKIGLPKK